MNPKQENLLFWMGLAMTIIGVLAIYILEIEMSEMELYFSKTILYLSGLGTIFFGWRKIDHKFPGKKK